MPPGILIARGLPYSPSLMTRPSAFCPAAKRVSGMALVCFARRSFKPVQDTRLQRRSARFSIADHEANRIIKVTDDDVPLQG
jgi:hypothetical protein